ncbi:ABC transporter permease subunit [Salipiger sp. P9]|nr:ABC transporter permease subunit [Salipiger pentaromativorans]
MTGWAWLALPGIAFVVVLFLVPLGGMVLVSLGMPDWTVFHYARLLDTTAYLSIMKTTLAISVTVTALAVVIGYPFAYVLTTSGKALRTFLLICVVLPYFTSVLVRTFAWLVLLGRGGVLNEIMLGLGLTSMPIQMLYNRFGVIVGMVHIVLPMIILPLYTVMSGIDGRLVRAARACGASPAGAFVSVFFPLSVPGVVAGVMLVFIYCLGFYITPALMGGLSDTMITMAISSQVVDQLNWAFGSALSVVLLASVVALLWIGSRFFPLDRLLGLKRGLSTASGEGHHVSSLWLTGLAAAVNRLGDTGPAFGARLLPVFAFVVGLMLLAPGAVITYLSFSSAKYLVFPAPGFSLHNYQAYLSDPTWLRATFVSLRVAVLAGLIATILGTLLSLGLMRGNLPGRNGLLILLLTPIIMPTVVVAVAIYFLFVQFGLQGTEIGLAIAHAVYAMPFVVVIVLTSLQSLNPSLEKAGLSLGANPVAAFRTITFPLIRPTLIVAGFFAFLNSFDDVVYALFLGAGKLNTLPMRMWEGIKQDVSPTISAVATLQMLLAALAITLGSLMTPRAK